MNNVKVKICGIRSLESAQAAIDAGADFLGFNFVKESKRYIYPIRAKAIINELRVKNYKLQTNTVGVFQNQTIDEVNSIADYLELDFVQLHGEENMEYMSNIKTNIIKAIVIPTEERVEGSHTAELQRQYSGMGFLGSTRNDKVQYLLLDRQLQGRGKMVDIQKAKEIAKTYPLFLAGGLNSENISQIVSEVQPLAVDVASGIETNGIENPEKIRLFIQNAKMNNQMDVGNSFKPFLGE